MAKQHISENIEIIDLGIYLEKEKLLAVADIHLGYEEALTKQGVLIPKFHFKDLIKRLEAMIAQTSPKTILINGDLKHEFGRILEEEWRTVRKLILFLKKNCEELIVLKGNHDKITDVITETLSLETKKEFQINGVLFCHGDSVPKDLENIKTVIIGHEHPAVSIRDDARSERFKCFLKGTYKKHTLIVMPSMNLLTIGTDVVSGRLLSPFLKQDLSDFEVWIVADQVYHFGKLSNLS